jgi:hypothetical protein
LICGAIGERPVVVASANRAIYLVFVTDQQNFVRRTGSGTGTACLSLTADGGICEFEPIERKLR